MLETAIVAFTTFFATVGPLDVAAIFAAITVGTPPEFQRKMAIRGTCIAAMILFAFAFVGSFILESLGISLAALKAAGGILLLLIGIDMVFARPSGSIPATAEEKEEAFSKEDISVFPLATPLIAGPGALGAVVLLMANTDGHLIQKGIVLVALGMVLALTLLLMLLANQVQKRFGISGMHAVSRIFGVLLAALAVQFLFDGLAQSGLFS